MRKFLITTLFISSLLTLSLIYILDDFDLRTDISFQFNDSRQVSVYYIYEDQLTAIDFYIEYEEDVINKTFSFLTTRKNSAPLGYFSKVPVNTQILTYEVSNNRLLLDLSLEIFNTTQENKTHALMQITNTFLGLGYVEVFITSNNQRLDI